MAITATERSQIVELTVMLFNGAPGAEYLSQIVSAYESTGRSLQTLANILADTPIYQTLYPNTQTADQFADALLTPLGLKDDAFARDFVISKMNAGVSKGAIVYEGYATLNSVPDSANNQYSAANAILNNKVAVAIYYSVDRAVAATDLASLQGALSGVTADPASVTTAKAAIDATLDFTLMAAAASVDEGSSITVHLTNGAPNTEYVLRVDSAHASDVGSQLTMVTTDASGTAHATIAIAADRVTEGAETLTISVVGQASVSTTVVVNDTSMDNAAPAISASATLAVNEGKSATFDVAVVDAEGDAVTVTAAADNGTLVDNGNGTYTYTPNAGFSGSDTITVTAADALGATSTQAIVVAVDPNDAPIAQAAGDAANEAGAAVSGQVVATDADAGDTLTFSLDAPVEGLTLNADGSYTFDPAANTAAAALVYSDAPLAVVANYTVTDALGLSSQNTLTITVTPTPLSFTLTKAGTSVQEGASQVYTVTASEAVTSPTDVVFTLLPGDGLAGNTGTGNTNTADFATGSFNPLTATIAAGSTTATFTVTPVNDATTELPEAFTVQAEVAGSTLTLGGTTVDATTAGGVGQTFTLTDGIDTMPGLMGSANSAGTDGNDTIVATSSTLTVLDTVNAGLGTDTLQILDTAGTDFTTVGYTLSNVENVTIRSATGTVQFDATGTGVTSLALTQAASAVLTAGDGTAVSVTGASGDVSVTATDSAVSVSGVNGNVTVDGGSTQTAVLAGGNDQDYTFTGSAGAVSLTAADQGSDTDIQIENGTNVTVTTTTTSTGGDDTGYIMIGGGNDASTTTDATGVVTVVQNINNDGETAGVLTGETIYVDGGTTVSITSNATNANTADNSEVVQSDVSVEAGVATTSVSVYQTAAVSGVAARTAVAGVAQVEKATFTALAAGASATINGLTFTAGTGGTTAAQTAAAFANLSTGSVQGASNKGVYSGEWNGAYSSGAVTTTTADGSYVLFTAGADKTPGVLAVAGGVTATTVTAGVDTTTARAGVGEIQTGAVTIEGNIADADVLATVVLAGYNTATIESDALTSLNIANSDASVTVTNTAATSLALGVNNIGADADAVVDLGTTYTSLDVYTSSGDSSIDLAAAGVTALTVSGDAELDLAGSTLDALKTVVVSGSAGLVLDINVADTVTSVNASATSGDVTATISGGATYTGGSGADNVTTTAAPTMAISLGAGNDSLTLAPGTTTSTLTLSGGDGTDTLVMAADDAAMVSTATIFETKIDGFEKLSLKVAATQTINLANMDDISYVISAGNTTALNIDKMAAGGTLELTGDGVLTDVDLVDATGTADAFNVVAKVGTVDGSFGVLDLAGIETLNVTATDTSTADAINTATMTLKDAALKTVNVGGNANVTLLLDANVTALTSVNGSAMTGVLNAYTNGTVAQTITGGSAADQLTAVGTTADVLVGGAGDDTLTANAGLSSLTGGAGADTFVIQTAGANVNTYATITDASAGDFILLVDQGTEAVRATKLSLGDTAVFQDYANLAAAGDGTANGVVSWFQFGGNTYVVEDLSAETSFDNGTDLVVKLAGLVDLSTASFNADGFIQLN